MTARNCPLCSHAAGTVIHSYRKVLFDDTPIARDFDLTACDTCGFLFYDTPTTAAQWAEFYANHYLIRYYSEREDDPRQRELLEATANALAPARLGLGAAIADVGCGPGHLLTLLRRRGHRGVIGVEVCEEHIAELRRRDLDARVGTAEHLPFESGSLDALVYAHLLEHLVSPMACVAEARRCLGPGGVVLVELPDVERYDEVGGVHPVHHFILEHINHFDPQHLGSLFAAEGFELLALERGTNDIMPIVRALFRRGDAFTRTVAPDNGSRDLALDWFGALGELYPDLGEIERDGTPVRIWGISYQTLDRISIGALSRCNIAGLYDLDPRKREKTVKGQQILHPDLLRGTPPSEAIAIGVGPSAPHMYELARRANPDCVIFRL